MKAQLIRQDALLNSLLDILYSIICALETAYNFHLNPL